MKKEQHKPLIETLINTAALGLTSAGMVWVTNNHDLTGLVLIAFGAALEFIKYYGRRENLW